MQRILKIDDMYIRPEAVVCWYADGNDLAVMLANNQRLLVPNMTPEQFGQGLNRTIRHNYEDVSGGDYYDDDEVY